MNLKTYQIDILSIRFCTLKLHSWSRKSTFTYQGFAGEKTFGG